MLRCTKHIKIWLVSMVVLVSNLAIAQSALQSGTWVQVSVTESGVYKITYEDLVNWGFSDISSVTIVGNGAGELSLINSESLPDTLHPVAVFMEKGADNVFNSGDYVLFYGQSPHVWNYDSETKQFSHVTHTYSEKNYYFVTVNSSLQKGMTTAENSSSATKTISSYDCLQAYEQNLVAPLQTGRNRFESISSSKSISFDFPHILAENPVEITVAMAGRHSSAATATVSANGTAVGNISFSAATTNKPYARYVSQKFSYSASSSSVSLNIALNYSGANSRGYLDFCTLHARCGLQVDGNAQLIFRDIASIEEGKSGSFEIASSEKKSVWDITNPENPKIVPTTFTSNITRFSASVNELHEYVAFSNSFRSVTYEKRVENQDILSDYNVDMIIVANDVFYDYAQEIADLHAKTDNLKTIVVSQEAICTEFSAGRRDIAAIRNFLRYVYERGNKTLRYVLLFGDGIYTNESVELNGSQIFTFQTKESLDEDGSICSDDFFALLGAGDGVTAKDSFIGEIDVAIGRFPVATKQQANALTYKTIQYATNPSYRGNWQTNLCFLADDADEGQTMHMEDANALCDDINASYPQYNIDKIFADAYEEVRSGAGERYPDVNLAIHNSLQKGCLIFHYSGHGNETRMMAEYAIDAAMIDSWNNKEKLPFFITAACNIAHFDYDGSSLGEKLLVKGDGGGIGIIGATRYSYASSNYTLCDNIYQMIFSRDAENRIRTIGEAFQLAKEKTKNEIYQNKRVYILLADPALRLAIPEYSVALDSINGEESVTFSSPIKALSTMRVSGHITDFGGTEQNDFNGTLYVKLFDKSQSISTLGNDGNVPLVFDSYSNILFQGLASVKNGLFSFDIKIPQDIYYYDGNGKLSIFAANDSLQAAGVYLNLLINGSETTADDDFTGPNITLSFDNKKFEDGAMTHQNPRLTVSVTDSSGVNVSNASFGHGITLTIDDDEANQILLNEFFYADLNTFVSGSLQYQLENLEEGEHTLTISVSDAYNNVTEETIQFYVVNSQNVTLKNLYNYPNPMSDKTYFHFEHNQAGSETSVIVRIYDRNGELVRTIVADGSLVGFSEDALSWDGTSKGGKTMPTGIYPYTIEIKTIQGTVLRGEKKIMLVR